MIDRLLVLLIIAHLERFVRKMLQNFLQRQQHWRLSGIDHEEIAVFFGDCLLKEFGFNCNASACQLRLDHGERQLNQNVISNLGQITFELEHRQFFQANIQPKFDAHRC